MCSFVRLLAGWLPESLLACLFVRLSVCVCVSVDTPRQVNVTLKEAAADGEGWV